MFHPECMAVKWFIDCTGLVCLYMCVYVFATVIITELETVLEMLRQEEIPTLNTSSTSQITEQFAVSELSRSSDVFRFKSEDDSLLSSPTDLNTSIGFCQEWDSNVHEDEPAVAGTGETLYVY